MKKAKKFLALLLILTVIFSLTGCSTYTSRIDDEAVAATAKKANTAEAVEALIADLPEKDKATIDDYEAVVTARTALNGLTTAEEKQVSKEAVATLKDVESTVYVEYQKDLSVTTQFVGGIMEGLFKLVALIGIPNYTWVVLLITIILKIILTPTTWKQQKSMVAMQKLQPKIKAIQVKYKDNPQKQQMMMQQLYKDEKISPFASCLPMLIQLPILYILFFGLRSFFPLHPEYYSFSWIPNLTLAIGATDYSWTLPILCAAVTLIQQLLSMGGIKNALKNQSQLPLLLIFPIMFLLIARQFPCLLAMYWIFNGFLSMIQLNFINFRLKAGIFAPKDRSNEADISGLEAKAAAAEKEKKVVYDKDGVPVDKQNVHSHNQTVTSKAKSEKAPWQEDNTKGQSKKANDNSTKDKPWQ